jgi:hypothetical protein
MGKEEVRKALASRHSAGVYGIGADPLRIADSSGVQRRAFRASVPISEEPVGKAKDERRQRDDSFDRKRGNLGSACTPDHFTPVLVSPGRPGDAGEEKRKQERWKWQHSESGLDDVIHGRA